ncbi:MAG TPA: hypothetical protein VGE45_02305 [Chloroflexia bacterium]|jgi:hypothetical protein
MKKNKPTANQPKNSRYSKATTRLQIQGLAHQTTLWHDVTDNGAEGLAARVSALVPSASETAAVTIQSGSVKEQPVSSHTYTNEELKNLCLNLMRANTEEQVILLLLKAGLWSDSSVWRYYGDYENNYNTIGNQQSSPDAAAIEKLINSVDARLMNECFVRGIDPEGPAAPQSIYEAVAEFFSHGAKPGSVRAGHIREWSADARTEVAKGITVTATGAMAKEGNPSLTVSDCGEGQTPRRMPVTLLSLTKSNKSRIPFVQGKFNMGGTGVLKFCGKHGIQLIVTRRNPKIVGDHPEDPSDCNWSFTIVRREDPEGGLRSSVFTYLAPVGAEASPKEGGVLHFSANSMPIFPEGKDPYARHSEWGTLIKLYEYSATGFKSNMLMPDGFLGRANILLPEVALPIRLHECREYKGHSGSFENTLTGLSVRLDDDKAENLEFSSSSAMNVAGEPMTATIYAFKKGKAATYRRNEGVIFTINGQTHGHLTKDFFTRKAAGGLSYIANDILLMVDCTNLSGRAREDLFMNSRDRLSKGDLRNQIERALEDLLRNHDGLRAMKERRRSEEIASRLEDSKPLKDTIEALMRRSSTLAELLLKGDHISVPFKTTRARSEEKEFEGKPYPTFFRFVDKDYGITLAREVAINHDANIIFETDANDDYFSRDVDKGLSSLYLIAGDTRLPGGDYVMPLQNGIAKLRLRLPDNCREGDKLHYVLFVTDSTQVAPFENNIVITVKPASEIGGPRGTRRKPQIKGEGEEDDVQAGIALPPIERVTEDEWATKTPPFDQFTALRIVNSGITGENGNSHESYDFYINSDNLYLKRELKANAQNPEIAKAQFEIGLVLTGLALIHDDAILRKTRKELQEEEDSSDSAEIEGSSIERKVDHFTRALAPFLLPIIQSLGALSSDDLPAVDGSGEAT